MMSPTTKLHLGSAAYCALLISLNWYRSVEYSREYGLTGESFAPIALAALLSLGVVMFLGYRCVRLALRRLESGSRVREGSWIESWAVILYALPLLWQQNTISSWKEWDGALATATGGYGHAWSPWVFLFAVLGLLLFQILMRLTPDNHDTDMAARGAVGAGLR